MPVDANVIGESIRDYLGMAYRPVGIKLHTAPVHHAARLDVPMRYCHAVHEAAKGRDFLFGGGDQICNKAEVILGFRDPKFVNVEPRIKHRIYAVSVGPLQDADQVLLVINPQQAMTMTLLLGGVSSEFTGRFSVCGEITAKVALDGEPKLSFLCTGARRYGEFEENEVVLGLPYGIFLSLPEKMSRYNSFTQKATAGIRQLLGNAR